MDFFGSKKLTSQLTKQAFQLNGKLLVCRQALFKVADMKSVYFLLNKCECRQTWLYSRELDLKQGLSYLERERERERERTRDSERGVEGGREREREGERQRGGEKEREGEIERYVRLGPNLEQPLGISYLEREMEMEREMGQLRLDLVFVFDILKIPRNARHNSQ